ncbi:elongation factor 1-beta [Candidatus Pacearchaeota archaeon CG10_big_fil_rev_8_21_14_0_10_32_42]|nr:MAG: elongation factor 1-beta [Candidatus Pacearchaeota archaeon CG10_big_fil_rev_8_21_14_0_10_32_42]
MGTVGVKIKVMPSSPETNLEEIKKKIRDLVEKNGGKNRDCTEEPIAFGLKAIIAFFEWPEEKELEELEDKIKKIKNVNSEQIIDMRKIA